MMLPDTPFFAVLLHGACARYLPRINDTSMTSFPKVPCSLDDPCIILICVEDYTLRFTSVTDQHWAVLLIHYSLVAVFMRVRKVYVRITTYKAFRH